MSGALGGDNGRHDHTDTGEPGAPPRVTIGLPVYNGEVYLAEALDSLLSQDYGDFELVISDNASTDSTPEICQRYALRDSRVVYTRNERNMGGAYNFSRLVGLARGEYFKWASADDLCGSGFLKACVDVLDQHPEVVLAYPRTMLISADGQEIGPQESGLHLPWPQRWRRIQMFVERRRFCNPCFGLMRTEVMRRSCLIRPYVSSDVTFLADMALKGPIHEVPETMFFRRVTDTSCGLGALSRRQVRAWFNPAARGSSWMPFTRIFFEIERLLVVSDYPFAEKLLTVAVFTAAWLKRICRTRYFVTRAYLRRLGSREARRSASVS